MLPQHQTLAQGGWQELSLLEQLGNVGSEVSRAVRWQNRDQHLVNSAVIRALELLDLTIADQRWRLRLKELTRLRELLCENWQGGNSYQTTLHDLDHYLLLFAIAARSQVGCT